MSDRRAADAKNTRPAPLGAFVEPGGTRFRVWTTKTERVSVRLEDGRGRALHVEALEPVGGGVFERHVNGVEPGARYRFDLGGRILPDPYARFLPEGVHGPAEVIEPRHPWRHPLRPLARSAVVYELHVGTFTPGGTYRAAIERLDHVVELGVDAIQLMPVSSFPGRRGWGYDGVAHFAPYAGYGSPDELREMVDAAHRHGLAVVLDVVYNHLGPSGNYLGAYSDAYFQRRPGPWGSVPDFTCRRMRDYVIENALYWLEEFGVDAFRLDATDSIVDPSPTHILEELASAVHDLDPRRVVVAEDERNLPHLVTRFGVDAILADDFHHSVHAALTRERDGYYAAFRGSVAEIARTIGRGWLYEGERYRDAPRGAPATELAAHHLTYCIQNHDQVGNRAFGERLGHVADLDAYAAASALLLTLPMRVLLFMGQEWAASTPFLFFTDHDAELGSAVNRGRREDFRSFRAYADPALAARIPDVQDERTFLDSRLRWEEQSIAPHAGMFELYRRLLKWRREDPVLAKGGRERLSARAEGETLVVEQWNDVGRRRLVVRFDGEIEIDAEGWTVLLRLPRAVLLGQGALPPSEDGR